MRTRNRDYPDCGVCDSRARYECESCGDSFCIQHLPEDDHDCPNATEDDDTQSTLFHDSTTPAGIRSHRSLRSRAIRHWKALALLLVVVAAGGLASMGTLDDVQHAVANATDQSLDSDRTERLIHERINEYRTRNGLSALDHDADLRAIASSYSERMVEEGFFGHTSPGGETFEDRYADAGYECRVPISDQRYATGAENLAQTYAFTPVETPEGTETYSSEKAVANAIVEQWLSSSGHRENILRSYWENEGIGVAVTDNPDGPGKLVIVTQNFC